MYLKVMQMPTQCSVYLVFEIKYSGITSKCASTFWNKEFLVQLEDETHNALNAYHDEIVGYDEY